MVSEDAFMKTVLVAGGAGFIGSHLIDSLLNQGNTVICADKLVMGDKNITHLHGNSRFKFYEVELTDRFKLNQIFEENKISANT